MRLRRRLINALKQNEEILRVIRKYLDKNVISGLGLIYLKVYFRT